MPFEIVRNDITKMAVDAIVNTANPQPVIGAGVDSRLHEAAGPNLLKARQTIGAISVGRAAMTPAYDLQAKFVIHTVGPVWLDGQHDEEMLLRSCYENALQLAVDSGCQSIAFPLISTGNYGFPKDQALQIAISVFSAFLLEHEMQIYLVVFDRASFKLSEQLFRSVASYIDERYVGICEKAAYGVDEPRRNRRRRDAELLEAKAMRASAPMACEEIMPMGDLDAFLKKKDAGFVEALLELIRKSGQKNSAIYKKANITKQHFSKLINNPNATITKPVAVAFALALELDLKQTRDLIGRAGYTLTNSSVFDLIIQYHIEHKNYNVVEINCVLFDYDQSLLGS